MRKILILGDTHANTRWSVNAVAIAKRLNALDIMVVGDFGYWPDPQYGHPYFLKELSEAAQEHGVTVWWVDGNHEDFGNLYRSHLKDHDEPVQIRPGIMWLPRGVTWTWEGVTFLAMGGAASIDRQHRTPGVSWFPEEIIDDSDVLKAKPATIMITHDSPINPLEFTGRRFIVDAESEYCRQQMRRVVTIAKPELLLHGHYHMSSDLEFLRGDSGYTRCVGLGCDGNSESMRLLTVDQGAWKLLSAFPLPNDYATIDQGSVDRANARMLG